jgi:hypothetical protein
VNSQQRYITTRQQTFEEPQPLPPAPVKEDSRVAKIEEEMWGRAKVTKTKADVATGYAHYMERCEVELETESFRTMSELISTADAHVQGSAGETRDYMAAFAHGMINHGAQNRADTQKWLHDRLKDAGDEMLDNPLPRRRLFDLL